MYTWNFSFLAYLFPPKTLYGTLQLWSIEEVDAYLLTTNSRLSRNLNDGLFMIGYLVYYVSKIVFSRLRTNLKP